jgi:hypothetical protein
MLNNPNETLEQELARLEAEVDAASGWGAAVGARLERIKGIRSALNVAIPEISSYQDRVDPWLMACFGEEIARDKQERGHRFLEEALELVQSGGCTAEEAHQVVDYVFGRPVGETNQEVGGVMVTLAALCLAHGLDMHKAGETELARVWTKVAQIRAKHDAKPKFSPLPGPSEPVVKGRYSDPRYEPCHDAEAERRIDAESRGDFRHRSL